MGLCLNILNELSFFAMNAAYELNSRRGAQLQPYGKILTCSRAQLKPQEVKSTDQSRQNWTWHPESGISQLDKQRHDYEEHATLDAAKHEPVVVNDEETGAQLERSLAEDRRSRGQPEQNARPSRWWLAESKYAIIFASRFSQSG